MGSRRFFTTARLVAIGVLGLFAMATSSAQRINFDKGWQFSLGHAADAAKDFGYSEGSFSAFGKAGTNAGPIGLGASDETWRTVDLPHDWVIELPFDSTADLMHGYKPIGRAFPQNSIGWYRKSFEVPKEDAGKRLRITFDGIYRDAYVWINGHLLGRNESGYIGCTFDLTDYVKIGARNVIAVRVNASDFEGWFYEGAGIYRHVWMSKSDPVHFVEDGIALRPAVENNAGILTATAEIRNETDKPVTQKLEVIVRDDKGKEVGRGSSNPVTIPARETAIAGAKLTAGPITRWSVKNPYLYSCEVSTETDRYEKKIGFRTFRFDPDKGFFLNDEPLKIQGTCNHQDHAGVGAAIPDRLNEWRVQQLKKIGCNFYRTSHNPPTPELLDACDRLGMMVLDETRMFGSTGEALSQLERLVRRDRNHPSVIFWSIGNEEWGTQNSEESARISLSMMRTIKKLDPTRPVTFGANNGAELPGLNSVVDIRGFNYQLQGLDAYRKARPTQPIHGSEVASTVTTRGEYADDPKKGYVAAYDTKKIDWGSTAESWWRTTLEREWFAGGFVWTGFDYRGEPTPYSWPNINSHFGILDVCGFPKDVAFYYQAWWTNKETLHIFPHWNHPGQEGKPIDVWVFANHEEVELFLNDKSLGRKPMEKGGHLQWSVPYAPGKLSGIGYRGGKAVQKAAVETTGPAVKLVLETEHPTMRAGGADIAVINVKAVDEKGRIVPGADMKIDFTAEGSGRIIGVGNGDPSSHEPDTHATTPVFAEISGWKFAKVTGDTANRAETAVDFDDSKWETPKMGQNQLRPGENAVFRAAFTVDDPKEMTALSVGPIDDQGWVYLNGKLVGTTNDWAATHRFDVAGKLAKGRNVLAIVAKNNGGEGGLTKGARLVGAEKRPAYSRSLFHGLAQVIVKSGDAVGTLTLRASSNGLAPATVTVSVK